MGSALSELPSDLEVLLPCSSCKSSRDGSWAALKNTLVFKFRGKAIYNNVINIYKPEPIKPGVWQQRCEALPCEEQTWILTLLVSHDTEYKGCWCSVAFRWSWLLGNAALRSALVTCPSRHVLLCRQTCVPHGRQQFHERPLSSISVRAARTSSAYVLTLMDEGSHLITLVMVRHWDQHS